ncbi:MAG: hypothetical protein JKY31_00355 [Rhodobacteraceae bacterium]|nr:hypothetical protein [Paracoccaceae bacterium]
MKQAQINRGGAPVALLEELPRLESAVVMYLRLWCDSPEGQAQVWQDFHGFFGGKTAHMHMRAFEELLSAILKHSRRPLQRHQLRCSCVGGDENAFANFVVAAALGEREDAILLASNFMRADMAMLAVNMAEPVGLALSQMVLRGPLSLPFNQTISPTKH